MNSEKEALDLPAIVTGNGEAYPKQWLAVYVGSVVILGGLTFVISLYAYTFTNLYRKNLLSTTPRNEALNALIFALKASAAAFVLLFTK